MAKQLIHVGLSVSTDGLLPGKDNLINLAACVGELSQFNINIAPQDGKYHESPFWLKHPVEFGALKTNPEPLKHAMVKFRLWLRQWQGNVVACTTTIDYWHLFTAMMATGKDCPFGSMPLDTGSYYAGMAGIKTPKRVASSAVPLEVAKERWNLVTGGALPTFGERKVGAPKKLATPRPTWRATLDQVEAVGLAAQAQMFNTTGPPTYRVVAQDVPTATRTPAWDEEF